MRITLFILCLLALDSCKKNSSDRYCDNNADDCYDVTITKQFFDFKLGSFWVLQDSVSGSFDTLSVTDNNSEDSSYFFSTTVHSSSDTYNYRYWPTLGTGCQPSGLEQEGRRCLIIMKSKTKPGEFVSETIVFFYSLELYDSMSNWTSTAPDNKVVLTDFFSSYTIGTHTFSDVVVFEESTNPAENNQKTKHFYAINHGLIRKELIDSNEVWNLVDFELYQ